MGVPVKKAGKGKKAKRPAQRPQLTAEELYLEAQMAWISEEPDQAMASLKRALEQEPENIECLNMYGGLLAEMGPREEAVAVLQKAVALQPQQGFEKYMYLAQLLEGQEAVASVRKGIELVRAKLQLLESGQLPPEEQDSDEELGEGESEAMVESMKDMTKLELCSALCALSELLVAGCVAGEGGPSSVAGVEREVEEVLGEARQLCPKSPEPLQALCSLRCQQDKKEEALQLLKQSMDLWFKPPKSDDEAAGQEAEEEDIAESEGESEGDEEGMDVEGEGGQEDGPSYEFRFETAKLLLELDTDTEAAVQVLEELVEENDHVPNVWLLLALALRGAGEWEQALAAGESSRRAWRCRGW